MNATIAIPVWWLLVFPVFVALIIAQTYCLKVMTESVRELFNLYWRAQHGEDSLRETPTPSVRLPQ